MESSSGPQTGAHAGHVDKSMAKLALAAIGIVFGDIGTSPLYTMSTVFDSSHGLTLTHANVLGVVSLIIWSLMIVVTLKYVTLIMRAHNHGEGGIMALLALASSSVMDRPRLRNGLLLAGVFGAALFYGDGVITPAISVLSAVEGLQVAEPQLKPFVVPIALVVLIALFLVQRHGTAGIGAVFGPVMVLWFGVIAVSGLLKSVARRPSWRRSIRSWASHSCVRNGWVAFVSLGAVVLALTGAEALYADMGHFGAPPIRLSWFALVLPALALNYLGQGALLLSDPKAVDNPFFHLFPSVTLFPMVVLATVATVIASQAVISGAFSMTKQAMQLGFMPRMGIVYTSEREVGQIYVPAINWLLLIAVVAAVLGFGSSTALGSAYGIAVTGTMMITTFLTFYVVRYAWHYNWLLCVLATGFFFVIDLTFFSANLLKFVDGGWFPLLLGAIMFTVMSTWHRGRELMVDEAPHPCRRTAAGPVPGQPVCEADDTRARHRRIPEHRHQRRAARAGQQSGAQPRAARACAVRPCDQPGCAVCAARAARGDHAARPRLPLHRRGLRLQGPGQLAASAARLRTEGSGGRSGAGVLFPQPCHRGGDRRQRHAGVA